MTPTTEHDDSKAVFIILGTGNQRARDILGEPSYASDVYYQDSAVKQLVQNGYIEGYA